ncbi:MAG: peptide chain release factor N(5)-glutamine methyltransferase [candidate division KSB1 bacterium]|nr:peptide chain release factor N(5)-glutamine methyltransferase [candidate division KSB1 bacterium]
MSTSRTTQEQKWTVLSLVRWATSFLAEREIENARLEVERMLAHVLGVDRVGLYLQFDRPLNERELRAFRELLRRRARREPLAYVLGEWEFFGLRLKVDRRVLVPRPETERVAEVCLDILETEREVRFLDLGTGSGNLAAAIAVHRPLARGWAIDVSKEAAELARENLRALGVADRVHVAVADMRRAPFPIAKGDRGYDLVVSNPPYVRPEEWPTLQKEITNYEPRQALVAEPDGLSYHRAVARVASHVLKPGGAVVVEIGADQAGEVCAILRSQGLEQIQVVRDLGGRDRVVSARKALP